MGTEAMTKDEALRRMKECVRSGDPEIAHSNADDILCEFLRDLGHGDLVDIYCDVDKWYA